MNDNLKEEPIESFFANTNSEAVSMSPDAIAATELTGTTAKEADSEVGEQIHSEEARLAAIMAYIPFLCFIPLINMRQNKEVYFHARQGVVLFLIELAAVLFSIDKFADFVFRGVLVAAIAAAAAGIYFALQGKNYRLPIVSDLADRAKL